MGHCRRCCCSARAAASSRATSRTAAAPRCRRCSRSSRASARRSRPRRRSRSRHARGAPPASLTFAAKAETIVVDDDLRPIAPGSGVVGRLATTRPRAARLLQGSGAQRAHVRRDRRRALVAARRHGDDRRRRHRAPARPRLAVHQHRRREGVPGRGRGGAEEAPARRGRGRRRRTGRPLGRTRRWPWCSHPSDGLEARRVAGRTAVAPRRLQAPACPDHRRARRALPRRQARLPLGT